MSLALGILAVVVVVVLVVSVVAGIGLFTVIGGVAAIGIDCWARNQSKIDHAQRPSGNLSMQLPVVGKYKVTSEFGMRRNPGQINHGKMRLHGGIDLAVTDGLGRIVAAAPGTVIDASYRNAAGNMVVIDHGGTKTRYFHLESFAVSVGDRVSAGTLVGKQGSTGNSTGPHLHFEVLTSQGKVNPRKWLAEGDVRVPKKGESGVAEAVPKSEPTPSTPNGPVTADPTSKFSPDQRRNALEIIRAGKDLELGSRDLAIGVMTAWGESTLENLDYGDKVGPDSRGLFQQRDNGAWGTLKDRMTPYVAATNFFTALKKIPDRASLEPTIVAHKVQRNADPYHYAKSWPIGVAFVTSLGEQIESTPNLDSGCEETADPMTGTPSGSSIVDAAMRWRGTPYSWGGGDIHGPTYGIYQTDHLDGSNTKGFDCSGLVLHSVYTATGIRLPRTADQQIRDSRGTPIPRDWNAMQPGDIVAFSNRNGASGSYSHIGIYIGNKEMVHAPRRGKPVRTINLETSNYYAKQTWSIMRFNQLKKDSL